MELATVKLEESLLFGRTPSGKTETERSKPDHASGRQWVAILTMLSSYPKISVTDYVRGKIPPGEWINEYAATAAILSKASKATL